MLCRDSKHVQYKEDLCKLASCHCWPTVHEYRMTPMDQVMEAEIAVWHHVLQATWSCRLWSCLSCSQSAARLAMPAVSLC